MVIYLSFAAWKNANKRMLLSQTLVLALPPDSLKQKIRLYLDERIADKEAFRRSVKKKRQSVWHM
jgi:hypothetical protein